MIWLTSVTEIVKAALWPAVVAFIIYILRSDLRTVLQSLRSVEVRKDGAKAEFKRLGKAAEVEKIKVEASVSDKSGAKALKLAFLNEITFFIYAFIEASDDPKKAAHSAWEDMDRAAKRTAERLGIEVVDDSDYSGALLEAGVLNAIQKSLFDIVGTSIFSENITPFEAVRYSIFSYIATKYLDNLKEIPPKGDD